MGPQPEDAVAMLTLASLPTWRLTRPQAIDGLPALVDRLLDTLG